ncbi:hypothetical protein ZYGR_0AD01400 [Zygosaccharomyces rouxii]|uniref:ZYRO0G09130p n=2 Tax=Zygosaccharomyces rouxii TaxID=4956 RepID=C5E024_ZYGRC|nr:uncharacterized protein ZYRO0G09130g [Zygosaccharomyces rouxii]KAH9202452.1 P-loop containing nucleoside triphosphate hydrolase protein [Zygosaccharomyces rouxii]GAV50957.1 hypothetical protein ZYGR_0AD01400 [Zygosaccharomyces rouxii]CAR29458.1 ZYRO0G09130p [Zygosaccharomyces rouxii]
MSQKAGFVVRIRDALFKSSLARNAPAVFPHRIRDFEVKPGEKWVIWGPGKGQFMNILSNKYLSDPPLSLQFGVGGKYPRVEQVLFKGVMPTAHLSARYEYFKDEFDVTCKKFILDNAVGSNNVSYDVAKTDREVDMALYDKLIDSLQLTDLQDRWAMGLSNGQMRRARLAYSLLKKPDLMLVDDPFLGLDPTATKIISEFLANYDLPIIIGLRFQDKIPNWCTHVCCVENDGQVLFQGPVNQHDVQIKELRDSRVSSRYSENMGSSDLEGLISGHPLFATKPNVPHLELRGLDVKYRGQPVLSNLHWKVELGSRWHVQGNNGSGKSTLLSLITAEHPQSWNSRVVEHGTPRRTGSSSYFDINKNIGMSAPELHAIFLKNCGDRLNVRESIATGFHEASNNNFTPIWSKLNKDQQTMVEKFIKYFDLPSDKLFGELSVSDQKLALFVRSIVKMPKLLVLDEAFSGMELEPMLRCHELLNHWPGTTMVVSHVPEETPKCHHYLRLVSPGVYDIGQVR